MALGTKKQHFVPQLLLRQFADAKERLYAYDMSKDRSFPTTVRDAGHQNHFLTIPALDGKDGPGAYFEKLFQTYEHPAMEAILKIHAGLSTGILKVVGETERKALSRFIALQYLRTPEARTAALQSEELTKRILASTIAQANGYNTSDPAIASILESFSGTRPDDIARLHGELLLDPALIEDVATKLAAYVWLLAVNRTTAPLYVADNPVSIFRHVSQPGFGLGLLSRGAEVIVPLSSILQLSLFERQFVVREIPELESRDGFVQYEMKSVNVEFERSLQAQFATQFIYCEKPDFSDARRMCERNPELRDPNRARVEAEAFGRLYRPS